MEESSENYIELSQIDTNDTDLHRAIRNADIKEIKLILNQLHKKSDPLEAVNQSDINGNTALHLVCRGYKSKELISSMTHLLRAGADIDLVNNENRKPLQLLKKRCANTSTYNDIIRSVIAKRAFLTSFIGKKIPYRIICVLEKFDSSLIERVFLLGTYNEPENLFSLTLPEKCLTIFKTLKDEDQNLVLAACKTALLINPLSKTIASFYLQCLKTRVIPLRDLLIAKIQFDNKILSYYEKQQRTYNGSHKYKDEKGFKIYSFRYARKNVISAIPDELQYEMPRFIQTLQHITTPEKGTKLKKCNYRLANDDRLKILNLIEEFDILISFLQQNNKVVTFNHNDIKFLRGTSLFFATSYFIVGCILEMINLMQLIKDDGSFSDKLKDFLNKSFFTIIYYIFFLAVTCFVAISTAYIKSSLCNENSVYSLKKEKELESILQKRNLFNLIKVSEIKKTPDLIKIINNLNCEFDKISSEMKLNEIIPVVSNIKEQLKNLIEIINQINRPIFKNNTIFFRSVSNNKVLDLEKGIVAASTF
jgi:hypothetical protein